MRSITALLSVALFAIAPLACAAQSGLDKTIKAYYIRTDALTLKKDVDGLSKLISAGLSADYVYFGAKNKEGKARQRTKLQTMQGIQMAVQSIDRFDNAFTKIEKAVAGKTSAVVTVDTLIAFTTKPGTDGKIHKLSNQSKTEDTWIKVGTVWQMKTSKYVSGQATLDGKTMSYR